MSASDIDKKDPKKFIIIKGARMHNLKNVSVALPRNNFIVITGLSGSGKSSLAFDTLYAEGQRRYVESLSSYARQFLGRLDKPDVDYIKGISPAIAIEQKVTSKSSRSTVGTTTEIYDYLKLLFARIGRTFSPISGDEVKKHDITEVLNILNNYPKDSKAQLLSEISLKKERSIKEQLEILLQQGFTRIKFKDQIHRIQDILEEGNFPEKMPYLLIDRFVIDPENEDNVSRIADSLETAFFEGEGACIAEIFTDKGSEILEFNNRFELDGMTFEEPSVNFFTFNNPLGACKTCEGFGHVLGIDRDLVIPDKSKSIYDDAIVCWKGEKMQEWKDELILGASKFNFPLHRPVSELSKKEMDLLWSGNDYFQGLNRFFKYVESKSYKIQYRVLLSRYRGRTKCNDCNGTRLRKDTAYVKIDGKNITELVLMPIKQLIPFFEAIKLNKYDAAIANRLLIEIKNRLQYLMDVGLSYLTLNRLSSTLSGGESQRINLATSLGSSLVGSMYILDEPSIGLHPRDTDRLISVLKSLQNLGNTVIVVEHDEEIMREADEIVDIGPLAGHLGGELVFQGNHEKLLKEQKSLTARYLTGKEVIAVPEKRRKWKDAIEIIGARENNLKNISVKIPLHTLSVITGVSGSGKSSLVRTIIYPALKKHLGGHGDKTGDFDKIQGDLNRLEEVEFVDQNPIGKSSRSNPVTYVKAFDEIRNLFSQQQLSKMRGYKPSFFSFNVAGGRCDVCEGEGVVKIPMQFMADIELQCENCKGSRYQEEILEVNIRDKSISDVLKMTINEAIDFFEQSDTSLERKIVTKLRPLQKVGLGYVHLGQSSSTLSGGEAQRVKLASFLGKGKNEKKTLFIFDEPTTGLHFHDVQKLLISFNELIQNGHSVLVIEHHADVIKCADWVIDLGPEGGEEGGNIVFEGTPEDLVKEKMSYTGKYLLGKLRSKN